ncbi:hypothetical protein WN55_02660 [Dufourea novaeangliae]|uniref:Uncharacterized protein n=1 Tax=Dufourea novaeangliae TaxID=178035 RepID=A0A154NXA8_DUFNO|nr:hypothetical protein WN55_02660 [Dufourea novaeangliae]
MKSSGPQHGRNKSVKESPRARRRAKVISKTTTEVVNSHDIKSVGSLVKQIEISRIEFNKSLWI